MARTNNRAVLVFIKDDNILLMYRNKAGREFYSFPGGAVEDGESIEVAAVREAKEETGLDIKLGKKLWQMDNNGNQEHYFLADSWTGGLQLGGPEAERQSPDNVYRLEWIPFANTKSLNIMPPDIMEKIIEIV